MIDIVMQGPAKNALGTDMMTWLLERLREADGRPVLLTGSGDAFSAGLNLKELASLDASGMATFLRLLERCMSALYQYPGPTVAWVNGHAIAGGAVLTLACDVRIATDDPKARIGLNEVALGVRFPPRVLRVVRDRVPPAHHTSAILGAALFSPDGALAHGLLDAVSEEPEKLARAELATLAKLPPDAYAATKAALRGSVAATLASDEALEQWMRDNVPVWIGDAVKQRIRAVLGK
jgi:enoyl-CoA hydratase